MKKCFAIIIFYIVISFTTEGAEYIEAPFQKYSVMLTQEKLRNFPSEPFPMVMFGEKFLCELPSEEEILFARNIIYPDVSVLTERINAMPCLLWRQMQWTYIVCPHFIYQFHNRNFSRTILGMQYADSYKNKNLEGFWGKGEQTFHTRHFTGEGNCGASKEEIRTIVWYFCRQSKEESIVYLQQISSCMYEIRIFTPRVCSGFDFESPTGHELYCYAEKDAMALFMANKDKMESPRYSLSYDFLDSAKGFRGDIFFVIDANIKVNKESSKESPSLNAEEICAKKSEYRADEIMSASMGVPFNFSVDPLNDSGSMELIWNVVNLLHQDSFYKNGIFSFFSFRGIAENLKEMIHSLKKDKKKRT
ncbi:hypothetical protein HNY73_020882 [Argiope bruennichi]|uniref:Uncharacterized protein n=1 Tax=Argiope bruennichi TaxID=94029 RepID=A0A8T0E9C0_ARGBR|nr:hypothetical protein HNY73_020882 [Argiope bruennichi]